MSSPGRRLMRFNQLKKNPNAIIRKKLYKKGKCWVVASSLAFASGLILLGASGMSVQADAVGNNVIQGQTTSDLNKSVSVDGTDSTDSNSFSSVANESKNENPSNTDKTVQEIPSSAEKRVQTPTAGASNGISDVTSNNDSDATQQSGSETSSSGTPVSNSQSTQGLTYVNYDPNSSVYTDTSNWKQSGSKYTIADNQIPDQIIKEGISQRGMDGTSPYFITKAKNLYFLNGTLDDNFTHQLITYGPDAYNPDSTTPVQDLVDYDFMRNNVLNIDTSLATKGVYLPENSSNMFSQLGAQEGFGKPEYAPTLNFPNINTSHVKNMDGMFSNDNISSLDLSHFDTSNVTNMDAMFLGSSISNLDLSKFNTSNVQNMSYMFSQMNYSNATSGLPITQLDLSNFNTKQVTNMSHMFDYSVFSSLNLNSFDTSQVTDMSYMFSNAQVPSLDLSNFNTSKVQTMNAMFEELNTVIDGNTNTYMQSPGILNVSSFKGDGLTVSNAIESMFMNARVKNINMPDFKVDSDTVTSASSVFNTTTADTVSIPNFDGSKIQNWDSTFSGAHIKKLDISTWNMQTNSDIWMFYQAIINQITLGPANKFPSYMNLSFRDNGDGDTTPDSSDQWISINENGIVDSPETALSFYAAPRDDQNTGNKGINQYYDGSGKVGVKTFVPMVGIIGKVTLNAPTTVDGKSGEDVVYPDLYGKIGVPITLDVPAKEGYRADKKTITATVTDKGITTDDVINYTKIPTGGGGGTSENIFISDRPQTSSYQRIATYPDQGNVTLYKQEGQKFVPITDRVLSPDSGWYFDKVANVGSENSDMKYYRVSTNEWVRANQAYLYQPNKVIIRTNAGAPKQLIHAEGTLATSRMLSPDTDWYSDLIGDLGESQYYRVATNEFVKKSDVTVIKNA